MFGFYSRSRAKRTSVHCREHSLGPYLHKNMIKINLKLIRDLQNLSPFKVGESGCRGAESGTQGFPEQQSGVGRKKEVESVQRDLRGTKNGLRKRPTLASRTDLEGGTVVLAQRARTAVAIMPQNFQSFGAQ